MKLAQLRYFTTLAELQNVSRASELLHMTQSSLSKNISAIEEELGVSLFDRNGKHISLNSIGQRFLDCCHTILNEYDNTMDDIKSMSTGTTNRIRVGTCGNISKLVPCMAEFKKLHPEVEYDINGDIERDDSIDINEYDVLVYPSETKYNRFNGYPLFRDKYYLAVSKSDSTSELSAVSVKSLNNKDAVFLRNGNVNEHAYNLCSALSVHFASISFTTSRAMHLDAIASGMAIGFVPQSYLSMYKASNSILILPVTDSNFNRQFNICFRRKKRLSLLAQSFEEYIIEKFNLSEDQNV